MADSEDDDEQELGEWEYNARKGIVRQLVPAAVLLSAPAARHAAEEAGRAVQFDFQDDRAVLNLLRLRRVDELKMSSAGKWIGRPLAALLAAFFVYWGGYVQYWESSRNQKLYYAAAGIVLGALIVIFIITVLRHWGNRARQKVRARAAEYRRIAHIARVAGADVNESYPHYGPYPFAANFHADAEDLELPQKESR